MPALTLYRRGRFWWLTGVARSSSGIVRVHESTLEIDEDRAREILARRQRDLHDELVLGPKITLTVSQAIDTYIDSGKSPSHLKPLRDHFSTTRVSSLNGPKIRAAAKILYPTAAYTSWNRQVVTPMKAVINYCADAGLCDSIKVKGFGRKDGDVRIPSTPAKRAVDRGYIDAFRAACEDPRLSALMLFMFTTAARLGDAIHLEDSDLDLDNRKATFRNMKNGEDGKADLTLEMVAELRQLSAWRAERQAARDLGRGARKPNNRVFGFVRRFSVYRDIKATCVRAGIPYLGTHQPGRHSFATQMIVVHGIDVATTAEKGRWKSKQLLVQTYTHGRSDDVIDQVFG